MSNYREQIETVEILSYEQQTEDLDDLNYIIEYLPDEEVVQTEEFHLSTNVSHTSIDEDDETLDDYWLHVKSLVEEEIGGGVTIPDVNVKIKLQRDAEFYEPKETLFRCCNRKCKRDNVVFHEQTELDAHNYDHVKQVAMNICPVCNKELATQQKLRWHMETRHVPRNYFCDQCGKVFHSKDNIRLHMSHHRKHFIVECRACKRTYKSIQSLRYHLRQHFEHHQCDTCGQVFEHKKLLLGHVAARHNAELMLPCRFCTRTFSRSDVRDIHERDIHKNGEILSHFNCQQCGESFDFRSDLMKHNIDAHYSGQIYPCEVCQKQFKKKSLLNLHMSSHREKSIQCDKCKMMFTFVTGLAKHKKLNRCKGPVMPKKSTDLSKEEVAKIAKQQLLEITVNFTKLEDLMFDTSDTQALVMKKQPIKMESALEIEDYEDYEIDGASTSSSSAALKTPKSSKSVINITYMNAPVETVTSSSGRVIKRKMPQEFITMQVPRAATSVSPSSAKKLKPALTCEVCEEEFDSKLKLQAHMTDHAHKRHNCLFCEKYFTKVMSLRKHYQDDHPDSNPFKEKKYQCDLCPKRYLTDFLLSQHKLSHENLKLQKCALCSFATNTLYDLKNHFKRIHQASKDFTCTEINCGKTFKRRCDMENHKKSVHSPYKIYVKCPVCEIIVLEKGLQSHMINRHSEKASHKPYKCEYCGKAERYEKNLQRHIESVHEPADRGVTYHCDKCPETFFRRRELSAHSFEHYNGPIYQCELCDNKYKSKKELTNHCYSHKSTTFNCEYCGQIFQTKSGRAKHYRKHEEGGNQEYFELKELDL